MKILLLLLIAGVCDAKAIDPNLIHALEEQESGHQAYPKGWNDGGKAKGWFQCHKDYWEDGCKVLKVKWTWKDAHDRDKATKVVNAYLIHYGQVYKRKTGKEPTNEVYSMIHHFGPDGWKNPNKDYWYAVKKRMYNNTNADGRGDSEKISKSRRKK